MPRVNEVFPVKNETFEARKGAKGKRGSKATLVEQPRGKELEYRIIAVNKAGDGESSNTAMVVL